MTNFVYVNCAMRINKNFILSPHVVNAKITGLKTFQRVLCPFIQWPFNFYHYILFVCHIVLCVIVIHRKLAFLQGE